MGTGGGFPGVPLAILFPESQFYLVDSIGKKIKVDARNSKRNRFNKHKRRTIVRAETISSQFDFIVSRAVTQMPEFVNWVKGKIKKKSEHQLQKWHLISERRRFIRRIKALYKHYRVSFI